MKRTLPFIRGEIRGLSTGARQLVSKTGGEWRHVMMVIGIGPSVEMH